MAVFHVFCLDIGELLARADILRNHPAEYDPLSFCSPDHGLESYYFRKKGVYSNFKDCLNSR